MGVKGKKSSRYGFLYALNIKKEALKPLFLYLNSTILLQLKIVMMDYSPEAFLSAFA